MSINDTWRLGDSVRVKRTTSSFYSGQHGLIEALKPEGPFELVVTFADGQQLAYAADELEKP